VFALDRGGLVGADGATHHGAFDLSYLRCIPNMVVMAPADENECRQMLTTAYQHPGPAAVRYPRGTGMGVKPIDRDLLARLARSHDALVSVEESAVVGGAGSACAEALADMGIEAPLLLLGLPDRFVDHGDTAKLLASIGLDAPGIEAAIRARFGALLQPTEGARPTARIKSVA
jgi:1-deoxy-D-xylulose-5-phosphate synthase